MLALILVLAVLALPQTLPGDFDHDGRPDVAKITPASGGGYDLIISRGAKGRPKAIVRHFSANEARNLYIDKARPGRWRTWCGKGGGNAAGPCPRKSVRLHGDTLSFGAEDSTEFVVIWTGRKFEVVQVSG
jgi:hypothetical protein